MSNVKSALIACLLASALFGAPPSADFLKNAREKISAAKTGTEVLALLKAVWATPEMSAYDKGNIGYQAGIQCYHLKATAEAREIWRGMKALDTMAWPKAEAYLETARMACRDKKYDEARENFTVVLESDAMPGGQRNYAGCELFQLEADLGGWDKANGILAYMAATLKPSGMAASPYQICQAKSREHDGKADEALALYVQAGENDKATRGNRSIAWNGAAKIAAAKGDTLRALGYLQKAEWPDRALLQHLNEKLAAPPFTVTPVFPGRPNHVFDFYLDNKFILAWGAADSAYRRPDEPKVKETGFDPSKYSFDYARMAHEAGFNILCSLFGPWRGGFGELKTMPDALKFWGEGCQRHHVATLPVLQFSQGSGKYRKFTSGNGTTAKSQVCPADWSYWRDEMLARAIMAAEVAKTCNAIIGVVLDFEMYVQDGTNYAGPCMCDACFGEFMTMTGNAAPRPDAGRRLEWIKAHGLFKRYRDYATWKMTDTCRKVERAIHAVKPDFIIAYVPFFEWFAGCTRGLGTPDMPTLVLSEAEYSTGFTPAIEKRVARLEKEGYPALFVPGIWGLKFQPKDIAGHMYQMAAASHGAWLYTLEAAWTAKFNEPTHTAKNYFSGCTFQQYQKAFAAFANALRMRAVDKDYVPNFTLPSVPDVEPPTVTLTQLQIPVDIDGALDDDAWKNAPAITFSDNANCTARKNSPVIKLAFDKDFFYIGALIPEPDMAALRAAVTENYNFAVFNDDILEFFFGYENNARVAHFGINANGAHAEHNVFVAGEDRSWRGEPVVRTARHAGHWVMETAFPWRCMTEAPVDSVAFNVTMSRRYQPNSAWSPTFGLYMNPDRFGTVRLKR